MSNNTDACTLDTCPISESIYTYRPSFGANVAFLALFATSGVFHLFQGVVWRKTAFAIAIIIGCIAEVIGYVGRVISYGDPFDQNGFLIQVCCLTIAPAFFSASKYFTSGDLVTGISPETSRIRPATYAYIFIPCDIVSLNLQGTGGSLASVKSQSGEDPLVGTNVMVAGLSFQVLTSLLFMALAVECAFRVRKFPKELRDEGFTQTILPNTPKFTIFVFAFSLAIICTFTRCVYRVIELSEGWEVQLIRDQLTFIVLEGV